MTQKNKLKKGCNLNTKTIVLDDVTAHFLKNLRTIRKNLGFTQDFVAQYAGIQRTSLVSIEKGINAPSLLILIKLAQILDTDISDSINYKFFYREIKPDKIKQAIRSYGLSYVEISRIIGFSPECVSYSIRLKPNASIQCLHAVLLLIQREKITLSVISSLTHSKGSSRTSGKYRNSKSTLNLERM